MLLIYVLPNLFLALKYLFIFNKMKVILEGSDIFNILYLAHLKVGISMEVPAQFYWLGKKDKDSQLWDNGKP